MSAERGPSGTGGTANPVTYVRVLPSTVSTFAGKVLAVVKIERKGARTSYLCDMPGYPNPGWFLESEVTDAR